MSEKNVVKETAMPITSESMKDDLIKLGVKEDDTLLVHSSLSSIGWVCGASQGVISALIDSVPKGNIIMPSHTGYNSDPKDWINPKVPRSWSSTIYDHMPAFDRDKTQTRTMGTIPEQFRRWPNVKRSNHPQTSFAAYGKDSEAIIKNHILTPQLGMESPLGWLYENDGKILLIGVYYDVCSALHLAEVLWGKLPTTNMGTALFVDGKRTWRWFDDFEYDANDFSLIGDDFEKAKKEDIVIGALGQAETRLFSFKELANFGKEWMKENR